MTEEEMQTMTRFCEEAAMKFARAYNFSGLSHNGWFNFYAAIQNAISSEWKRAKALPKHDKSRS